MFTVAQFDAIANWPPDATPHTEGTGQIVLINGEHMIGTWTWHKDLRLGHLVDANGKNWFIDPAAVIAFSPQVVPPPLVA